MLSLLWIFYFGIWISDKEVKSFFLYMDLHILALLFFFLLLKTAFNFLAFHITIVDFTTLAYLNYYFILFWGWFRTMCRKLHDNDPWYLPRIGARNDCGYEQWNTFSIIETSIPRIETYSWCVLLYWARVEGSCLSSINGQGKLGII